MTDRNSRRSGADPESAGNGSLIEGFLKRAGKVAGGTLDMALDVATMSAMYGDGWLRDFLASSASPERLDAMAEAGRFLRDARETAGLSLRELSERLELGDDSVLEGVEKGEAILPLELMLRTASLLARHDPVPFLIKFLRSYNPQLEATLEQWGVMALPKNYERERRFVNLYRQHDFLRDLDEEAHARFIEYMDASTRLVVDVMKREAEAPRRRAPAKKKTSNARRKTTSSSRRSATASSKRTSEASTTAKPHQETSKSGSRPAPSRRPQIRKVKPRTSGS